MQARNAVVVLMDSLNRHLLGSYGGSEFATPNLDRFAADAVRFTQHYSGSLPCMPARHDLLVGSLDFLWRPWARSRSGKSPSRCCSGARAW
jgi:arylsulfatase A-like enzyme